MSKSDSMWNLCRLRAMVEDPHLWGHGGDDTDAIEWAMAQIDGTLERIDGGDAATYFARLARDGRPKP